MSWCVFICAGVLCTHIYILMYTHIIIHIVCLFVHELYRLERAKLSYARSLWNRKQYVRTSLFFFSPLSHSSLSLLLPSLMSGSKSSLCALLSLSQCSLQKTNERAREQCYHFIYFFANSKKLMKLHLPSRTMLPLDLSLLLPSLMSDRKSSLCALLSLSHCSPQKN